MLRLSLPAVRLPLLHNTQAIGVRHGSKMAQQRLSDETLDKIFPVPSPAPSPQAPGRFPGITPTSTAALRRVLKENHVKWHIFFNDKRFHKCVV